VITARKLDTLLINAKSYMAILIDLETEEEGAMALLQIKGHPALGLTVSSKKFHLIHNLPNYLD